MTFSRNLTGFLFALPLLWGCASAEPAPPPAPPPSPVATTDATASDPPAVAAEAAAYDAASAALVASIDSIARAAVAEPTVPGVAVAVARGPEVLFARGYGLADLDERLPVTPETVFRVGSITKQFTAAAILQLVEQGKLDLDASISEYLPNVPTQGNTVTVRQLLNHTSGMKSYTNLGERWQSRMAEPMTPQQIVDLVRDERFEFAPGEKWAYNNTGYVLLGMIIEEVTGRPYAEYIEDEFFEPLGLENTSYCPDQPGAGSAEGYKVVGDSVAVADPLSMTQPYSAGALCSTVLDLITWQQALTSGEVVSDASYRRMITPDTLTDGSPLTYGYGLGVGTLEDETKIAHGGGINGFLSQLSYYPEEQLSIAVLANSEGSSPSLVEERVARIALGIPAPVREDLPLDEEERARYLGTYDLGMLQIEVFEREARLMAQATNQPAFPLLYQGDHTFLLDVPQEIRLVFDVQGEQAEGFVLHQGRATVPAKRVK